MLIKNIGWSEGHDDKKAWSGVNIMMIRRHDEWFYVKVARFQREITI